MLKLVSLGLVSAFLLAAPASAADYAFTIGGTSTASGVLTVQDSTNPDGSSLITAITGTYNGQAIQGLRAIGGFGGNDNLLFVGRNPLVTNAGFTFFGSFGDRNIYSFGGGEAGGITYADYFVGPITFSIAPVTAAVPEPGTWALMLLGFGGIGLAMRRRRAAAPALQVA